MKKTTIFLISSVVPIGMFLGACVSGGGSGKISDQVVSSTTQVSAVVRTLEPLAPLQWQPVIEGILTLTSLVVAGVQTARAGSASSALKAVDQAVAPLTNSPDDHAHLVSTLDQSVLNKIPGIVTAAAVASGTVSTPVVKG